MDKKLLLIGVVLLLVLPSVFGARAGSTDESLYQIANWGDGSSATDQGTGRFSYSISGGDAYAFTSVTDYFIYEITTYATDGQTVWLNSSTSINGNATAEWDINFNDTTGVNRGGLYSNIAVGAECMTSWNVATGNIFDQNDASLACSSNPHADHWYTFIVVYDNNTNKCRHAVYNNTGEMICSRNATTPIAGDHQFHGMRFGFNENNLKLKLDNMTVYAGDGIANGRPGSTSPGGAASTDSPTFHYPSANLHTNTNITIQLNHTANVTYFLYINNMTYGYNRTQNASYYYQFFTNLTDGIYIITAGVQNKSNGVFSPNISRTFYIDTLLPTITINPPNTFKTTNHTLISSYLTNLTLNISFVDENLGEVLINITNTSNKSIFSFYNSTTDFGGNATFNYSAIVNIASWPIGERFTATIQSSDLHTALAIEPYTLIKDRDSITYNTKEDINIKIKCLDETVTSLNTAKLVDRYTFNSDCKNFLVTSNHLLVFIKNSNYNAHFVTRNGIKGNWIDFQNKALTKDNYKIEKIDDFNYKVSIINLLAKDLVKEYNFESIGGLNVVTQVYDFYIGSVIDITTYNKVSSGTKIDSNITLQNKTLSFSASTGDPVRFGNITNGSNLLMISSGYRNLSRNLTITSNYYNLSYNMTPTDAIVFSFFDETTGLKLEDVTFSFDFISTNDSRNFTSSLGTVAVTSLPFNFLTFRYLASEFWERFYYIDFTATSPVDINLYTINDTLGVETTATVYNQNNKLLEGVYIVAYRFDINNNRYNLVEMCKTNFEGECVLHLQQSTEFYYFKLYSPFDTLRQTTSDTYITSNSIIFQISTADSWGQTFEQTEQEIYSYLYFDVPTKSFIYSFNDTSNSITQGCLYVYVVNNSLGNLTYNSSCVSAFAGTITLGVSQKNGTTYAATGLITLDSANIPLKFSSYTFQEVFNNRNIRLFLIFILTITFMFAFKYSLELGVIILPLPLLFASLMGFIQIDKSVAIGLELAAFILAIVLNKVLD